MPELMQKNIPRAREIFPSGVAHYNDKWHTLTFRTPSGGESVIQFGYCENENDVERYQGTEYTRIVIDESTRFLESQVRALLRFNRSSVSNFPRQMLLTTNPIGPGYGYHYLMFIKRVVTKEQGETGERRVAGVLEDRTPYKIYDDATWSDGRRVEKATCFIPAKLYDNPVLMRRDPGYEKNLLSQEGPIAQALLDGRWDVVASTALDFLPEVHVVRSYTIPPYARRWMSIDWGSSDKACAIWFAADERRVVAYRDYARPGKEIKRYAYDVAQRCVGEKIEFCALSHECFGNRGMQQTQADQFAEVFDHYGITLLRSDKDAEGRLLLIREFMRHMPIGADRAQLDYHYWVDRFNREGPEAMAQYRAMLARSFDSDLPKLLFVGPECPYLITSLPLLTVSARNPHVLDRNQDDHGFDALGYGLKAFTGGANVDEDTAYRALLGTNADGSLRVPDSMMGYELARKRAREFVSGYSGDLGTKWGVQKFGRDGQGGSGGVE